MGFFAGAVVDIFVEIFVGLFYGRSESFGD
jgi:hypothetical protein